MSTFKCEKCGLEIRSGEVHSCRTKPVVASGNIGIHVDADGNGEIHARVTISVRGHDAIGVVTLRMLNHELEIPKVPYEYFSVGLRSSIVQLQYSQEQREALIKDIIASVFAAYGCRQKDELKSQRST